MAKAILPSEADGLPRGWSRDHLRLHRLLLHRPTLLPPGASLLLAVSGGQDSMAMAGLLRDLQHLHRWRLQLWHGDHGWRADSARQARELEAWARSQQLPLSIERLEPQGEGGNREQIARNWRYRCLLEQARRLECSHVLTAHTATDRAETVLLHLARGSHRRGLAGLRLSQPLADVVAAQVGANTVSDGCRPLLVRPLQLFSRQDTGRICPEQGWPIWVDPSNEDPDLSRNRVRQQVLPVLEALHPGADRRISSQADRLAEELMAQQELIALALPSLCDGENRMDRQALLRLSHANQRLLLRHWLERHQGPSLESASLDQLLPRLPLQQGPGRMDLAGGWQLHWKGSKLILQPPAPANGHG